MLDTPAVLRRVKERLTRWQADIADILAERSGLDPRADLRPRLTAGVALTAFQTAIRRWADGNGTEHLLHHRRRSIRSHRAGTAIRARTTN